MSLVKNTNKKNINKKAEKPTKVCKSYLTKRGYVIMKEQFDDDQLEEIRNKLLITPFENPDYKFDDKVTQIKVFQENANKLYLPKMWAIKQLGLPDVDKIPPGTNIDFNSLITLRPYQELAADICIKHMKKTGGGILSLPCGRGKTIVALQMAAMLGKKCLIIVHKDFLVQQWCDHILGNPDKGVPAKFEGSSVGIIKANKFDIIDKQFVIGTIQSISMKTFPLAAFDSFGLVILDEAHLVPCKVFSKALQKVNSTYMLGLTATPRRKDGLFKILKMYVGDIMYKEKPIKVHEVAVKRYMFDSKDEGYCKEVVTHTKFRTIMNRAKMIENVVNFVPRNRLICKTIRGLYAKGYKKVLVLSERIAHLQLMRDIVESYGDDKTCSFYTGKVKKSLLPEAEKADCIFGTYSMAAVGMDIPDLDALIMASPMSDIEQALGRILRKKCDYDKLVIDVVDQFSVFINQSRKRMQFYKGKKYNVVDFDVGEDGVLKEGKHYDFAGPKKLCGDVSDVAKTDAGSDEEVDVEAPSLADKIAESKAYVKGEKKKVEEVKEMGNGMVKIGKKIRFKSNPFM